MEPSLILPVQLPPLYDVPRFVDYDEVVRAAAKGLATDGGSKLAKAWVNRVCVAIKRERGLNERNLPADLYAEIVREVEKRIAADESEKEDRRAARLLQETNKLTVQKQRLCPNCRLAWLVTSGPSRESFECPKCQSSFRLVLIPPRKFPVKRKDLIREPELILVQINKTEAEIEAYAEWRAKLKNDLAEYAKRRSERAEKEWGAHERERLEVAREMRKRS